MRDDSIDRQKQQPRTGLSALSLFSVESAPSIRKGTEKGEESAHVATQLAAHFMLKIRFHLEVTSDKYESGQANYY